MKLNFKNFLIMGTVVWITGLSASGKTTLANKLIDILQKKGYHPIGLDGDELRNIFNSYSKSEDNHNKKNRMDLAFKYSKLSQFLSNKGNIVIISTISMFNEIYKWNRKNIKNYFEIYLKVPIKELKNRDPKKIYSRYFNNEIKNVAGLDLEIDEPYKPDLLIEFPNQPYSDKIVELLEKKFLKIKNG